MSNLIFANHRLGLGPDPKEFGSKEKPIEWLRRQVRPASALMPVPATALSSEDAVRGFLRAKEQGKGERKEMRKTLRTQYRNDSLASLSWAVRTENPFAERWVQFWSNHFTVSTTRKAVEGLTGSFEREVIRAHCFGSFENLLLAVVRHPAMLVYLDNVRSVGPNSRAGRKQKGLNENLAREIMELHTLGVAGGYTEADVQAISRVLTGWSLIRKHWDAGDVFQFREQAHEPGTKTILGQVFPQGQQGGVKFLKMLAHHPSTARFIATKIATHFVSDEPSSRLVQRLEMSFKQTGGDLSQLALALIEAPETWIERRMKLKTPVEWVVGMARASEGRIPDGRLLGAVRKLGQAPYAAASPKGWPERAEEWMGPEAVLSRLDLSEQFGRMMSKVSSVGPRQIEQMLGPKISPSTRIAMDRAATPAQQWALLVMSPEFQRR